MVHIVKKTTLLFGAQVKSFVTPSPWNCLLWVPSHPNTISCVKLKQDLELPNCSHHPPGNLHVLLQTTVSVLTIALCMLFPDFPDAYADRAPKTELLNPGQSNHKLLNLSLFHPGESFSSWLCPVQPTA